MSADRPLDPDAALSARRLRARQFRVSDLADSLATGWQIFRTLQAVSIAYRIFPHWNRRNPLPALD